MINGVEKGSSGSITIPTNKKVEISEGDYLIEGIIKDIFNLTELMSKYQVFKVISVDDNRKGNLKHYKIGVAE